MRLIATIAIERLALALSLLTASAAQAADHVTWLVSELAPRFIYEGPLKGHGYGDEQIAYLQSRLPQFEHGIVSATIARALYELAHTDNSCLLTLTRTPERAETLLFSARPVRTPSSKIIVKQARVKEFSAFLDGEGAVDLSRLATSDSWRGGYVAARHTGGPMQEFIAAADRKARMEKAMSVDALLRLLARDRIDFVFASYLEALYEETTLHLDGVFTALTISGSDDHADLRVACSNSPLGKSVIASIDALLASDERWREFLQPLKRWLTPADFARAVERKPDP